MIEIGITIIRNSIHDNRFVIDSFFGTTKLIHCYLSINGIAINREMNGKCGITIICYQSNRASIFAF